MNTKAVNLEQHLPANKFYPPRFNASRTVFRKSLVTGRLPVTTVGKTIIFLEAQAGQGKTTLAQQYLQFCRHTFVWYQVGSEDNDPVLFLSALQLILSRQLEGFASPRLLEMLNQEQAGLLDLRSWVNLLLNDLDRILRKDLFIVFDDLHLIKETSPARQALDYLIDSSPPRLHFLLTSRHPPPLKARLLCLNPQLIYLDSDDLAFDIDEVLLLYKEVFNRELSHREAEQLQRSTGGWIMGLVLTSPDPQWPDRSSPPGADSRSLPLKDAEDSILPYFEAEILSEIPPVQQTPLIILSFLDEIDLLLAEQLTENTAIGTLLDSLAKRNIFVYRLDDNRCRFRFHHLFQDYLQTLGSSRLGPRRIEIIHRRAARFHLDQGRIEEGLKALRKAEAYREMERVLIKHGLKLFSANRNVTIFELLGSIPESTLLGYPWLTLFYGMVSTDISPRPQLLPLLFSSSRERFERAGEERGELITLASMIYFHFVISGDYQAGSALLPRTHYLFQRNRLRLPPEISIVVTRNLAAGYCFFSGELKTARRYAERAYNLARQHHNRNVIASSLFILGFVELFSGNHEGAAKLAETSYRLTAHPLLGMINRLSLQLLQLCLLSMTGQGEAFNRQRTLIGATVDPKIVRQTIAAPHLYIWSALDLIARGKIAEAGQEIEAGQQVSSQASSAHFTSQFLQWRALIRACDDDFSHARTDIDAALELRGQAGGFFYTACNLMVAGAVNALMGHAAAAEKLLRQGLELSRTLPSPFLEVSCLAYLALLESKTSSNPENATLSRFLQLMRKHRYRTFWGWNPSLVKNLLCRAVRCGTEVSFARELARERLGISICPDGSLQMLLSINLLGTFSVSSGPDHSAGPESFSSLQRELIGLLISSRNQMISQEQVQLVFWPESSPEKARKRFDTLLSRLRKTIRDQLGITAQNYILLDKGYLQLRQVRIDAIEFCTHAQNGLKHAAREHWWEAGNSFSKALAQWQTFRELDSFANDQTIAFVTEIENLLRRLCLVWGTGLCRCNRPEEALSVLRKAGPAISMDEECIRFEYGLLLRLQQPLKAAETLRRYSRALQQLGYDRQEAEEAAARLGTEASEQVQAGPGHRASP